MLIAQVTPSLRKAFVLARAKAMQRGSQAALEDLKLLSPLCVFDKVAILLLRCEILYLDNQIDVSAALFDVELDPLLADLSSEDASLIVDNRFAIARAAVDFHTLGSHYHEVDIRRLLWLDIRDWNAAAHATDAIRRGKHHDSLPTIWNMTLNAYQSANWRASCLANADLARQCNQLGSPAEAIWHAIQSLDRECVSETASLLKQAPAHARVPATVKQILQTCSLKLHAFLGTRILHEVSQFIPDDQVQAVIHWLEPQLAVAYHSPRMSDGFEYAWRLLGQLASRLPPVTAFELAQRMVLQDALQSPALFRRHVIRALNHLVSVIDANRLTEFVQPATTLTVSASTSTDYLDSLELVCHLADRNADCKEQLRTALSPSSGSPISNPAFFQALGRLGSKSFDQSSMDVLAEDIAQVLRKQVEVVEGDEEPPSIGGFGTVSRRDGTQRQVVHISGGQQWADAVVADCALLSDRAVATLANGVLDVLMDDRNVITNRVGLVDVLQQLAPRLPCELADRANPMLCALARGQFQESSIGMSFAEATHPLNPFRMNSGDPRQLRGNALVTLALGSTAHKSWNERLHDDLLRSFLESDDGNLRRYGISAASWACDLQEAESDALIATAFDEFPEVRAHALRVLAHIGGDKFDRQSLRFIARAIVRSGAAADSGERESAAVAAATFTKSQKVDEIWKTQLTAVLVRLSHDPNYLVRKRSL